MYLMARRIRATGVKMVLSGEGSDEIFGGYPHFRRDMLLYDNGGQDTTVVKRLLSELENANPVSRGLLLPDGEGVSTESITRLLGFTPSWMATSATMSFKQRGLFAGDFLRSMQDRDAYRPLLDGIDVHGQLAGRAPVHQSLYLWSKTVLPNYILTVLGDRWFLGKIYGYKEEGAYFHVPFSNQLGWWLVAATTFSAASAMLLALMMGKPESARIFLPSSSLVPFMRTTSGTFSCTSRAAATIPVAMVSHFMMPPKILTRIAFTPLTEQPLGEIEPFLHLAQLASHLTDLVTKDRDLSLASLVQHARVHPRLLEPHSGDLQQPIEDDAREGNGQRNDRNEQSNDLLIHSHSGGRRRRS
jgi:hypothetical protein